MMSHGGGTVLVEKATEGKSEANFLSPQRRGRKNQGWKVEDGRGKRKETVGLDWIDYHLRGRDGEITVLSLVLYGMAPVILTANSCGPWLPDPSN